MNRGEPHVSLPVASASSVGTRARTAVSRTATPTLILAVPSAAFPARKARNQMTVARHASEATTFVDPRGVDPDGPSAFGLAPRPWADEGESAMGLAL